MITSTSNDQVKLIRKLREKKYRSETGLFYIEGIRIVVEAMQAENRVQTLIIAPELTQSHMIDEVLHTATMRDIPVLEVSESVFNSFALKDGPQGVAALVSQSWDSIEEVDWKHSGLWVGLDSIADPGNLGTIMRTMDAVAAKGILLIGNCTDPFDPSSIRASMGAIFSLKLIRLTADQVADLKANTGLKLIGTSDSAKENYQDIRYPADMVLMMGSERQGLQNTLVELCDHMASIPMAGKSDSLNLAVATGVMLYEVYNQHKRNSPL